MRSHSFSSYFFLLHFRFLSRPLFPAIMLRRFNGQKRQKKVKEKYGIEKKQASHELQQWRCRRQKRQRQKKG